MLLFCCLGTFVLGLAIGLIVGLAAKKTYNKQMCETITLGTIGNRRVNMRCELDQGHSGPHLHTVPEDRSNAGEKLWWNN